MKSPFADGEAVLLHEKREVTFRKETFSYVALFYRCEVTGLDFTTTGLDEINIGQVYNQYRCKYGISFPDEMKAMRERYGLSAAKMSEVLGLGTNQYRLYENGEIPSEVIGKSIKSIENPEVFKEMLVNSRNQFEEEAFLKLMRKVSSAASVEVEDRRSRIFGGYGRSLYNGYAPQSVEKLKNILLYFIGRGKGVFNTKMNKLLFYTDFYSYKIRGVAMTGLAYRAIQYGPVPYHWNTVYEAIDEIGAEIVSFPNGMSGESLESETPPDMTVFSDAEAIILDKVFRRFEKCHANEISEISHQEDAWKGYVGKPGWIGFDAAFSLKAL